MIALEREQVIRRAWEQLDPALRQQGYELVEVEYVQQYGVWVLRLFIDKTGGVALDDCQAISQWVGSLLDVRNFIEGAYTLEVSSPGFDRPVRKPADFERFAGEPITVLAQAPINGRKQFKGELKGFHDGLVVVACDGVLYEIHIENLKKAHLNR
jgi:ribosome maturation factor RimP